MLPGRGKASGHKSREIASGQHHQTFEGRAVQLANEVRILFENFDPLSPFPHLSPSIVFYISLSSCDVWIPGEKYVLFQYFRVELYQKTFWNSTVFN